MDGEISFDPVKRAMTLAERGLDFAEAGRVFDNRSKTVIDDRSTMVRCVT